MLRWDSCERLALEFEHFMFLDQGQCAETNDTGGRLPQLGQLYRFIDNVTWTQNVLKKHDHIKFEHVRLLPVTLMVVCVLVDWNFRFALLWARGIFFIVFRMSKTWWVSQDSPTIKVCVRVRPFIKEEARCEFNMCLDTDMDMFLVRFFSSFQTISFTGRGTAFWRGMQAVHRYAVS